MEDEAWSGLEGGGEQDTGPHMLGLKRFGMTKQHRLKQRSEKRLLELLPLYCYEKKMVIMTLFFPSDKIQLDIGLFSSMYTLA